MLNWMRMSALFLISCFIIFSFQNPLLAGQPVGGQKSNTKKRSQSTEIPPLLLELDQKYTQAKTMIATFSQLTVSQALKQKKQSNGILMFKRPNKVRWQTLTPDPSLLISNGRKVWFYSPPFDESERGQVIERPASALRTQLANTLLSGSFTTAHNMKMTQKTANIFVLFPKNGAAGTVRWAEILVEPQKKLIEKVVLEHRDGNRAEITLSKIQLGQDVEDGLFEFIPPPNTDRIRD